MRKNIKLFIANKEVDCSEGISLPITYTVEDFQNPTIVKNSFSKTISIPGTKNNNKIFGEIYKLDRLQHIEDGQFSGINFNPSKRVDFGIYNNGDLIESGYMQLNTIQIKQKVITYNITLYGGLGDFFYGLKYKEDGSLRTLADLQYFITDEEGNVLPADTEMNFYINKDFVNKSFNNNWDSDFTTLDNFVGFIPAYNGLYENFDNETCLINTAGDTLFPKSASDGGTTYTPYNGYALAQLNRAYTEWEIRDLRSYMQRPVLKLSKLIETICRKENSGYDVIFDDYFFNYANPYWSKSFVALPLLGSSEDEESDSIKENAKLIKYGADNWWVGLKPGGTTTSYNWGYTSVDGSEVIVPGEGNIIDLSATPANTLVNISMDFQVFFNANASSSANNLYLSYVRNGKMGNTEYHNDPYRTSLTVQILVYNADDESAPSKPIAYSPLYNFTNKINTQVQAGPSTWFNYYPLTDAPVEAIYGHFVKDSGQRYYFKSDTGSNTFRFVVKDMPKVNKIRVSIQFARRTESLYNQDALWISDNMNPNNVTASRVAGWSEFLYDSDQYTLIASWPSAVTSDALITKQKLLKTESTPADYLLSYAKMFGLYFIKDIDSKTIRIFTRNNFFKNKITDWSKRIDYSKDFSVNPLLFDKKWYTMKQEAPETYYAKKYNKQYDITYGQQRLDTGYNFNSDNTDLYSDNLYENVISARDVDKYYRNYFNSSSSPVPCFLNDNITYQLFHSTSTERKTNDQDLYGVNFIDSSKTTEWWDVPGNDIFAKTCFYSLDNDEQSLEEIKSTLLFYNGNVEMKDIDGNPITYWITDDVTEMSVLNDSEPCYLYTTRETNEAGAKIAIKRTSLPQFIRYNISSNYVISSWDFGLPREIYIDKIAYPEQSVIYSQFWKEFYTDQFDVNTKKVTCFVKLNDLQVNFDMLRQFYYFEDSYWVLNKIDAYDVNSDATTRCEFIRVQDINNYIGGVSTLGKYIEVSDPEVTVGYEAGSKIVTIESNVPWKVSWYNNLKITNISPMEGLPGISTMTIEYNENPKYIEDNFYLSLVAQSDIYERLGQVYFYQTPDPSKSVKLSGKVTDADGKVLDVQPYIYVDNDNFVDSTYCDATTGEYYLYVQKGVPFHFEVQLSSVVKYEEELTLNADTVKNITI